MSINSSLGDFSLYNTLEFAFSIGSVLMSESSKSYSHTSEKGSDIERRLKTWKRLISR